MGEIRLLREWIRTHPGCVACGSWGSVQKHHVKTRGSMRGMPQLEQDRNNIVPLCPSCHDKVHKMGRKEFELAYRIDLKDTARYVWRAAMKGSKYDLDE